jgi:hypothetical protein
MSNDALKRSLVSYPAAEWDAEIDLAKFSEAQFVSALVEILKEHGHFPVQWGATRINDGLSVVGNDGSYIGNWNTVERFDDAEGAAVSTASEDLGDADMASHVIFRTYFSTYAQSQKGDGDAD